MADEVKHIHGTPVLAGEPQSVKELYKLVLALESRIAALEAAKEEEA